MRRTGTQRSVVAVRHLSPGPILVALAIVVVGGLGVAIYVKQMHHDLKSSSSGGTEGLRSTSTDPKSPEFTSPRDTPETRYFIRVFFLGGFKDAWRVEAFPNRADAEQGDLIWENETAVELLAQWKGETFSDSFWFVRHANNPAVEGWIRNMDLWCGPVSCPQCGKKADIWAGYWSDWRDPNGRPLGCSQCDAPLPRIERPAVETRKPEFEK
jgi:hypothetical protein